MPSDDGPRVPSGEPVEAAEQVATFVLQWSERLHGRRVFVGKRRDVLAEHGIRRRLGSSIDRLADQGVRGLSEDARRVVLGLHAGTHHAEISSGPFAARHVIALQAAGRRCISLLPEDAPRGPYQSPLAFAAHDLEHLAQFFAPAHFWGQLGFFQRLHGALDDGLGGLLSDHDQAFGDDVNRVGADTNGSSVFAFASLVMKLKMAARRALARRTGTVRTHGALTSEEEAAFAPELERLVAAFRMPNELLPMAARVGTRRADHEAGVAVLRYFESVGAAKPTRSL